MGSDPLYASRPRGDMDARVGICGGDRPPLLIRNELGRRGHPDCRFIEGYLRVTDICGRRSPWRPIDMRGGSWPLTAGHGFWKKVGWWSACAFSPMGILFRLNIRGRGSSTPAPLSGWSGTGMCMRAGGDGPPIWAYLTNIPFPYG